MRTSASGPLALSGGCLRRVVPMITRKCLGSLRLFLRDDEGLVTLEWVALAAAVIVLAIGTIIVIQTQLNTAASTVGSEIVSTVQSNT
jgi:Flp pilus assembly pilin Flp